MIMYSAIAGGCRKRLRFCLVFSPYAISNHCLRGCDAGSAAAPSTQRDFNPRAHEGRDLRVTQPSAFAILFQSTRPRGARHRQQRDAAA